MADLFGGALNNESVAVKGKILMELAMREAGFRYSIIADLIQYRPEDSADKITADAEAMINFVFQPYTDLDIRTSMKEEKTNVQETLFGGQYL